MFFIFVPQPRTHLSCFGLNHALLRKKNSVFVLQWNHGIIFITIFKACLELIPKYLSVNGISRLIGSVCLGPKVIQLSGAHCIVLHIMTQSTSNLVWLTLYFIPLQETRVLMSNMPEVFDVVIACMSRHETTPKVFSKGCGVLWKLAHQPEAVKVQFKNYIIFIIIFFFLTAQ